jgi:DHA3 family tetracycline resistance protein-like MFS transporter
VTVTVRDRLGASVLGVREFRWLWAGQLISSIGDGIFPVAVAVKILDSGGTARDLGFVLAGRAVALVVFVLFGGILADRMRRTTVMIGADGLRAIAVLGLALVPGEVPVAVLAALVFAVGAGEAFFRPAYGALLPTVLPR